ncbi:MAG TPA: flagellar motor protein MotB [Acidocella sp.]|jgi:chemotaxis protein MotB|uniref:flagellar motor protein MotB n=1 Tax=Acidocella sp. TaxID=50710 RepID=UPI002B8F6AC0|nr:flagellar motor protein MotB [Acidocella sp.]HVE21999.1 flagellar motor protein MotB [Acidocella sp.]
MAAQHNPKVKKKAGHERWLVSYADLMTLLLALFVVLYASSTQNKVKIQEEEQSIIHAFHGTPISIQSHSGNSGVLQHQPSPIPKPVEHPAPRPPHVPQEISRQLQQEMAQLQAMQLRLQSVLQPLIGQKQVTMSAQPLTLTISFSASTLYDSGQATLSPPAKILLTNIAGKLKDLPDQFSMVIQGYTDNQPIATPQFPSNWSLSVERAVSVVTLFVAQGIDGTRLSAQGFGEFAPSVSNATADGRAQNRRVVVVIRAPAPSDTANDASGGK